MYIGTIMPALSKTFEFYNPWSTKNTRTTQPGITMPQMINGQKPDPVLTIYSNRIEAAGYYGLGSRTHSVSYTVEGAFMGTCTIQVSTTPNPGEGDWTELTEDTRKRYLGIETTGSAGITSAGAAISHPTQTDICEFTGNYAWVRARLDISRGSLRSIRINF